MSFTRKSSGEDAGLYDTSDGDLKAATVHYVYAHTRRHRGSPLTHGLQTFWERIPRRARLWIRLLLWLAILVSTLITIPSVFLAVSEPRYTSQPERYRWLSKQIRESLSPGAGNLKAEKIFIATNVNSARLIQGAWGKDVKHLVHILGPENVFLSLYVDDVDEDTATALRSWGMGLHCNASILIEPKQLHGGANRARGWRDAASLQKDRVRRRNLALRPLDASFSPSHAQARVVQADAVFDKILCIDDVHFRPVSAVHLLFSTNSHNKPRRPYAAACALDSGAASDMQSGSAVRDADGHSLGVRFFPWFARTGSGASRAAMLSGQELVPVRSCWGGLVAFDARWFQGHLSVRFKATADGASQYLDERRLLLADVLERWNQDSHGARDLGVYINPYVRVARSRWLLHWIPLATRFEHGTAIVQDLLTRLVSIFTSVD